MCRAPNTEYSDPGTQTRSSKRLGRVALEVSTLFYFLARSASIPIVQEYVYYLVARKYNYTSHNRTAGDDLEMTVSSESSLFILYMTIAELFPAAIVVLALGTYSDVIHKRRFLMWLPCVGTSIYATCILLPTLITPSHTADISHVATIACFLVGSLLSGLTGSITGFMSGYATYVSDETTSGRHRSVRLAVCELTVGLSYAASSVASSYWISRSQRQSGSADFFNPMLAVLAASILAFLLLFFLVAEPPTSMTSLPGVAVTSSCFRRLRTTCGCCDRSTFSSLSSSWKSRRFLAIFFAFQLYSFVQQGQERTVVLFVEGPLNWSVERVGLGLLVLYGLAGLGCWPAVPLMQRFMSDLSIAAVSVLSKLAGSALMAASQQDAIVYAAFVVQLFHLTPYAVVRSLASQHTDSSQQGSVYALLHCTQAVVAFLGPVSHTALFTATVRHSPGTVFLVSGSILLIPLLLLAYVRYLDCSNRQVQVQEADESESLLAPGTTVLPSEE